MTLQARLEREEGVLLWSWAGALTAADEAPLREQMHQCAPSPQEAVVVDCSQLLEIDTGGLGALLQLLTDRTRGGGDMILACVSMQLAQIFHVTRLDRVFPVVDNCSAGLRLARQSYPVRAQAHELTP